MRFPSELPTNGFKQVTTVRHERTQEFRFVIFFVPLHMDQDRHRLDPSHTVLCEKPRVQTQLFLCPSRIPW